MINDDQIMDLIRGGHRSEALASIYRHYPKIRQLVVMANGSEEDAKDLFQEGVIIFYQKAQLPDFRLTAAIGTFIYSVCRNLWLKRFRDVHARQVPWETIPEPSHFEAETWLDEAHDAAILADQVLKALGEPCLSILKNFYYQKLSMRDIADRLGLGSENNAKLRKFKCLERAKKMVKERSSFFNALSLLSYEN